MRTYQQWTEYAFYARVRIVLIHISMLDLLEDFMVLRGIAYLRLDGSVSRARRAMVIRMVCSLPPSYPYP